MNKCCFAPTLLALALAGVPHVKAELLIGLTVQNGLVSFDSATPGTVSLIGPITGLTAGDTMVGIDRRPQVGPNNGLLYGLGVNAATGSGRIYTLNQLTGAATLISTLAADPADTTAPFPFATVSGTAFGVDFNPVPDRFRVVSNTGQNLRINVDNGLVQFDGPLAYQAGDPNFGVAPIVTSVAYSNNFGGATTTVLQGVDVSTNPDTLVTFTNPNGGTLQTVSNTGINGAESSGFDISGATGTSFFAFSPVTGGSSALYTGGTGGLTLIGTIGGGVALRGLAAPVGSAPSVPDTGSTLLAFGVALLALGGVRRKLQGA